jgi:plasmid stability protein
MVTTLQIRNVPEEVHTAVQVRAVEAGLSISDYLLELIRELVLRPTMAEVATRARALAEVGGGASRADVKRAIRLGRDP